MESFVSWAREQDWIDIERESGLARNSLEATARIYGRAKSCIGIYGMGLTQQHAGVETVRLLVNLLLLRGNIGKRGAGICPVRGHSNVQGQRTVGVSEKPELVPLDRLAEQYGFEPPRSLGLSTVEACEKILANEIEAFLILGGNFVRAAPDHGRLEPAWRHIRLTVNVATKLNRSQLIPGQVSFILPVIGRIETDRQATGDQAVSMEDTSGCIHGSKGVRKPASPHLISEVRFVAELAKATLEPNPNVPWDDWVNDYSLIRKAITVTYPEIFYDYETRMWEPGGFQRPLPARERIWKTKNGKANFVTPSGLLENTDLPERTPESLRMMTLRSNDQFNTTVYGYNDRFRGINGTRDVVLMNRDDIDRLGLVVGAKVRLETESNDGYHRQLGGLAVVAYAIPLGCIGTYYPEANVLLPTGHYAKESKTPAAKSIPVRIFKEEDTVSEPGLIAAE